MPKTAEEVLTGLLSTTIKLDETGVAALKEADGSFKDDTLDILAQKHAEHITTIRGDVEAMKRDRYSIGKKEALEGLERELRDEFGYKDATKKGKELIKDLIQMQLQAAGTTDEAKIKASAQFRELERKLAEEQAKIDEKLAAKEAEVVGRFEGERNISTVLSEAATIFEAWNPVLPGDAAKAANQKRVFLDGLRSEKFQVTRGQDGKVDIVVMKPDGSGRMEDSMGHAITLKSLVEDRAARMFEQRASDDRNGAPDPNKVGNRGGDGSGKYPATMTMAQYSTEYERLLTLPRADRITALEVLKAHGKALGLVP